MMGGDAIFQVIGLGLIWLIHYPAASNTISNAAEQYSIFVTYHQPHRVNVRATVNSKIVCHFLTGLHTLPRLTFRITQLQEISFLLLLTCFASTHDQEKLHTGEHLTMPIAFRLLY